MTGKELLNELQSFSKEELELNIQLVASGTKGCPVFDDIIAPSIEDHYYQYLNKSIKMPKVIHMEID